MDISALLGTVLSNDSVQQLSKTAGVSTEEVQNVLGAALPSLLNGALAQAEDGNTAEGFAGALNQHSASDLSNLGAFFSNVDMQDGSKIVAHLLGSDTQETIDAVSKKAGVSSAGSANVLAAAAPLLMSLLGQETNQQQQAGNNAAVSSIMGALIQNVDMGKILSGLLGASGTAAEEKPVEEKPAQSGGILGALGNLFK